MKPTAHSPFIVCHIESCNWKHFRYCRPQHVISTRQDYCPKTFCSRAGDLCLTGLTSTTSPCLTRSTWENHFLDCDELDMDLIFNKSKTRAIFLHFLQNTPDYTLDFSVMKLFFIPLYLVCIFSTPESHLPSFLVKQTTSKTGPNH